MNEYEIKPLIINQTICTIEIHWNPINNCDVYKVIRLLKDNKEIIEYWGSKTLCKISNLDENFCYKFQIFALKFIQDKYSIIHLSDILRACTLPNIPTTISLHRAIKNAQEYLLKRYVKLKPNLFNLPGPNGLTPLAMAVTMGNRDLIEILLNANPDVNLGCPIIQRTPLHLAMFYGHIAIAKMLIDQKADKKFNDINGLNYGHYAIDGGHFDAVKFVLQNGINIEEKDCCGWTLLLRAVTMQCNARIIKLLLEHKCNVKAMDNNNQNAIQLATITEQKEILDLLTQTK